MPRPGHEGSNQQLELYRLDSPGLHELLIERRHSDSGRLPLGIPPQNDAYQNLSLQSNQATELPADSQGSSWDRLSRTSHSPSYSFPDANQTESNLSFAESPTTGIINPQIMLPVSEAQATQEPRFSYNPGLQCLKNDKHHSDYTSSQPGSSHGIGHTSSIVIPSVELSQYGPRDDWISDHLSYSASTREILSSPTPMDPTLDFRELGTTDGPEYPSAVLRLSEDSELGSYLSASNSNIASPESGLQPPDTILSSGRSKQPLEPPSASGVHKRKRTLSSPSGRRGLLKINDVRDKGACLLCQFLHEECISEGICPRCRDKQQTGTVWKELPCIRVKLPNAEIHRTTALSFPDGVPKLKWRGAPKRTKTIVLYSVGYPKTHQEPSERPWLEVTCREFQTNNQEALSKSWLSEGKKVSVRLPAYALQSPQKVDLDAFLDTNFTKLLVELQNEQHSIVSKIIAEASRHLGHENEHRNRGEHLTSKNAKRQHEALKGALKIAVITRLISQSFSIMGTETLGQSAVRDPESPYYGRVPAPTFLGAQIDGIYMEMMKNIKKNTLSRLKSMIFSNSKDRQKHWYIIFLTIMVLLCNLETLYRHQSVQKERYQTTNPKQEKMMEEWEQAAGNLQWHFRGVCHGAVPLQMDWHKAAQQADHVDLQAVAFLTSLKDDLQNKIDELRVRAKDPPTTPLVWISGLFLPYER